MRWRRVMQRTLAAVAFAAAAACFAMGFVGWIVPWLAAMVASLALLTIGFHLASAGSSLDESSSSAGAALPSENR